MAELADAPPEMEVQTYFGELQQIFSITVPWFSQLHLNEPERLFLAAVKECNASFNEDGFWEFTAPKKLVVIDIGIIQCAISRIFDQGKWVIIDRSGDLAHINIADGGEVSCWNLTGSA